MIRFLAILAAILAAYILRDILASLIFSVIVASAIEPAILWLKERRVPRILGVILVYAAIASFLFFVIYLFIPLVVDEAENIIVTIPEFRRQVLSGIGRLEILPFISILRQSTEAFLGAPLQFLTTLGGGTVNAISVLFGGLLSFILIVVFSFYLAAQEKGIESFLRLITPLEYEPYVLDLWERSQRKLGRWVRAQMLLAALVGVIIFFGLTLLGVKHALFLAMLAAIFEVIPVVGPILAAVPAVVSTFLVSPILGGMTVALYVIVQQVESHIIVPVVMKKTVGLSPLVVLLALLSGAKLGGVFGVLLAVPITAIVAEFINDWDKKKRTLIPE